MDLPGGVPVPSNVDNVLDTVTLRSGSICGCCGQLGSRHRPIVHATTMLRAEANNIESIMSRSTKLSEFPFSEGRYAEEKKQAHGVKGLADEFGWGTCQVGRDLGGIPTTMPGRHRCSQFICVHSLNDQHLSIYIQLKQYFLDVVKANGGVDKVVENPPWGA